MLVVFHVDQLGLLDAPSSIGLPAAPARAERLRVLPAPPPDSQPLQLSLSFRPFLEKRK